MALKDVISKLESNPEFKTWKKENYASSLVHIFRMFDEANKGEFQIGFFNKDETITSFIVGDSITLVPPEEIFKKPDEIIQKLSIEEVSLEFEGALIIAKNLQKSKYPAEVALKEMVILQHLSIGQVYNITFITKSFKTLNIKIDSASGKIISHNLISLADLKAK